MRDCRIYGFAISIYDGCGPTRSGSRSDGEAVGAMMRVVGDCGYTVVVWSVVARYCEW